jgi:hypothetical protein
VLNSLLKASFAILLTILTSVCLTGCGESGPELASVSGKLTKGGQPLASVSVTFSPSAGGPSSAAQTDAEGRFVLVSQSGKAGAVLGEHKVTLQHVETSGSDSADPMARMKAMMDARGGSGQNQGGRSSAAPTYEKSDVVPEEYTSATKTPLKYTVSSGSNEFDIPLP